MSVISRDSVEHYLWGEACDGWRLLDRDDLSVIAEKMPPATSEKRHYHEAARQLVYVLSGSLTIDMGGTLTRIGAGQAFHIPPGRRHLVTNEGPEAAEFLMISSPSHRGDRIEVAG